MAFEEASNKFEIFRGAFERGNYDICQQTLSQLKIAMVQFSLSFLRCGPGSSPERVNEFVFCRRVLEMASLLAIKMKDMSSFERHVTQVKTYYEPHEGVPTSDMEEKIRGLYLIHLLSSDRHSEFLTEIELIPHERHQTSEPIRNAIQLENWLVAASYSKIFEYRQTISSDDFSVFSMDRLIVLTRLEIASCLSKAYPELPIPVVQEMMHMTSREQLESFVTEHKITWRISDANPNVLVLGASQSTTPEAVPSLKLISRSLAYAKELERIV
jgi:26S proteasome regulatory subunit N12